MLHTSDADGELITEGVIDAAALSPQGWFVVDWKTDAVAEHTWQERLVRYTRQVEEYVAILSTVTGQKGDGIVERVK
jgi:ATP-dependent exoDNAse (exonuclease V) beta subunit